MEKEVAEMTGLQNLLKASLGFASAFEEMIDFAVDRDIFAD